MKENKLYPLFKTLGIVTFSGVLAFFVIQIIEFAHEEYLNYKNPIEPGREMFLVRYEENPFEKHDTLWVKVIEVKRGYVRYEQKIGDRKDTDTSSSHIGWLRHFTPVR
jgi:hypothetical protein